MDTPFDDAERAEDAALPSPTGVNQPEAEAELLARVAGRGVAFINLEFSDVVGLAKSVTVPADELPECLARGKWFDGSAIESFARVAETDMYLRPDLATFAEVPWSTAEQGERLDAEATRVGRLICDVIMPTGERFPGDPRATLIGALAEANALGYRYEVAPELEFFLLRAREAREMEGALRESRQGLLPLPHDQGGYFDLSTDLAADVRREIVAELRRMGVRIEASHHEVAAGQHEIDFAPGDALQIADAVLTARYVIKAVAQRHGLWATFLPKPFFGVNGSGFHVHQQLLRLDDGADAFAGAGAAQYRLSPVARYFIAGQLDHAPALTAIVAPLVNSYKRLVSGFEAPVMVSWGRVSREALVRATRTGGATLGVVRVELRNPDPSCNPYLAFASMLRAGLDGVRRGLALPAPVEEGLYTLDEQARLRRGIGALPATLGEALAALQSDDVILDALGEQIAAWFIEAKTQEWTEYRRQVHAWELERYLPLF